jgi:hypothetical protein
MDIKKITELPQDNPYLDWMVGMWRVGKNLVGFEDEGVVICGGTHYTLPPEIDTLEEARELVDFLDAQLRALGT